MKYIDTKTQTSLKHGIMDFLNLTECEMEQIFESIYYDTEKEPWEWVQDFLTNYISDEKLEYLQMFHLSRRLDGTDIKINNNLQKLLIEETPISKFFKKYNITFKKVIIISIFLGIINCKSLMRNMEMIAEMLTI